MREAIGVDAEIRARPICSESLECGGILRRRLLDGGDFAAVASAFVWL